MSDAQGRARTREAARLYASLKPKELATLRRVARRLDETFLTLDEYAKEIGVDERMIWRARIDMGLTPCPIVTVGPKEAKGRP